MKKITFLFTLIFCILNSILAQKSPFLIKSKIDRAKFYHYQAIKLATSGKPQKAIKKLQKAIHFDRRNEYLIDLANLYAKTDKCKSACRTVEKIIPKDTDPEVLKVELTAWKAFYALSMGEIDGPVSAYNNAITAMQRHHIDSLPLLSNLWNNRGVARIYNQSVVGKNQEPEIHIMDIQQAKMNFQKAIECDSANCVAKYNLEVANLLLDVNPDSLSTVRNIKRKTYQNKVFPSLDCTIPPPSPHQDILTKLNKEKEVVFVLDISGSMTIPCPNGKSRFENMQEIVISLIQDLDPVIKIGLITVGGDCDIEPKYIVSVNTMSREQLLDIVQNKIYPNGGTPLNAQLQKAMNMFDGKSKKLEKAIFLCSDGINSCGNQSTCALAESLNSKGVKVYAFALLLENNQYSREYSVYDCLTKATYGEMLGITETKEIEVKTTFISESVFPLVLTKEDLLLGKYTPKIPKDQLLQSNPLETENKTTSLNK